MRVRLCWLAGAVLGPLGLLLGYIYLFRVALSVRSSTADTAAFVLALLIGATCQFFVCQTVAGRGISMLIYMIVMPFILTLWSLELVGLFLDEWL